LTSYTLFKSTWSCRAFSSWRRTGHWFHTIQDRKALISEYLQISLVANIVNQCFKDYAIPSLFLTSSIVFSVAIAMIVHLNTRIFSSLITMLLPMLLIDSASVITVAATMCTKVYILSLRIKLNTKKFTKNSKSDLWFVKKERSLRSIRVQIGDCFFDRSTPLESINISMCNAISVLLAIKV